MSLENKLIALAQAIGADVKALKASAGDLTALSTAAKENLVAAINELYAIGSSAGATIDDTAGAGATAVAWSADKITSEIAIARQGAKDDLIDGAGAALDTLKKLADALNNDPNFAATIATDLASRVRYDAIQTLNTAQKLQVCTNIGVTVGATKNRADSENADRVHTHDVGQVTGLMDAIANIPSVPKSAAYTVTAADKGASIDTTTNVTIPASVFAVGDVIVVTNTSASDISITPAAGVTFRIAGPDSTGPRTLAGYGVATFRMASDNVWFGSGTGLLFGSGDDGGDDGGDNGGDDGTLTDHLGNTLTDENSNILIGG